MNHKLKEIEQFIKDNPDSIGNILNICSNYLQDYLVYCEKQNNMTLRTALSLTLTILASKRRLPDAIITQSLEFIKKEIFPKGIDDCICPGEIKFYKKYFECLDK